MNMDEPRTRDIFRMIVEEYLRYGAPIGSQTISKSLKTPVSSATIRNIMADLADADLLFSPHTSAGRQPTERGLRLYVDSLMKVDDIPRQQKQKIDTQINATSQNLYDEASTLLSSMSSCVGVVIAPKLNKAIRKFEFLKLEPHKVLCILVTTDGMIENRIVHVDSDVTKSDLEQVTNFLNDRISGQSLTDIQEIIQNELSSHRTHLHSLASTLVHDGIIHPLSSAEDGHIFVSGQSQLLDNPEAQSRLDEMKTLFRLLEEKQAILSMMSAVEQGDGVQIFIGSENPVFERPTWSTIIRAYHDQNGRIIGATAVIGPTRINYGKIVPIVDYTALVVEKLLGRTLPY
jgi:heat-inducible transcriptional repressor